MGYWKKHSKKELEAVLEMFHQAGWRIEDPPKYYKVMCPERCGNHYKWIHLTPSDVNYGKNAVKWLERQPCYERVEATS